MRPVEGTILTVARGAATEAGRPPTPGSRWWTWPRRRGRERPRRWPARRHSSPCWNRPAWSTPEVPAYLLLFDALLSVLDGRPMPTPPELPRPSSARSTPRPPARLAARGAAMPTAQARRSALRGDVPARGARRRPSRRSRRCGPAWGLDRGGRRRRHWNCHIHTDDIGAAIEAVARRRATPFHPGHRPAGAGRGGALGARRRRRRRERAPPRRRPVRPRPPAWWPWRPATGSDGSSAPSASRASSRGGSR